jgi:hypothetical protein
MQIAEQPPETTYPDGNETYIVNDIVLFAHPTRGILATLGALWICEEALNAADANQARSHWAPDAVAP